MKWCYIVCVSETNDNLYKISELAAEVAAVLSEAEVDQSSGRVTEVPSTRTIRYYTTHGLLDGPVEFRGRTALYGRRHLLQLVAIKRLQARGVSLTDVQSKVVGASDEALAELAEISVEESDEPAKPREVVRRTEDFWAQAPAEPAAVESNVLARELDTIPAAKLADGVALLLHGAERDLYPDDLEAIRVAAEPLIKLLKRRNLI